MTKRLLILAVVVLGLLAAWPTLFNVMLKLRYELGNEYMMRQAGEPGSLSGEWRVTFDTFECGIDGRARWRLFMDDDSTGTLYTASYYQKHFAEYGSMAGSFQSLLPYDRSKALRDTCNVRALQSTLVVTDCSYYDEIDEISVVEDTLPVMALDPGLDYADEEYWDTMFLHYQVDNNRLYVREVYHIGEQTDKWGFSYSPRLEWKSVFAWWW